MVKGTGTLWIKRLAHEWGGERLLLFWHYAWGLRNSNCVPRYISPPKRPLAADARNFRDRFHLCLALIYPPTPPRYFLPPLFRASALAKILPLARTRRISRAVTVYRRVLIEEFVHCFIHSVFYFTTLIRVRHAFVNSKPSIVCRAGVYRYRKAGESIKVKKK